MIASFRNSTRGMALLGILSLARMAAGLPVYAGQGTTPQGVAALRLQVDKPIIHLGEALQVAGYHFTPGARVEIRLHGPMSATLGGVYARVRVNGRGGFSVRVAIVRYPDAAARQLHTVTVAAISSALLNGAQEGAAVAVQADPMPGVIIATRGTLSKASFVIDGTTVPAQVAALDAAHYRISYAGHLRAGVHSAYLKWTNVVGGSGARSWSFRIGWPYAVSIAPGLNLGAYRIHLGDRLSVAGSNFTPGANVTISLGGPNAPLGAPVARAIVTGEGTFQVLIPISRYPDANAGASHMIYIAVGASGPMVGDLPEGVAVPVQVLR